MIKKDLATFIRSKRIELGWSQKKLADKALVAVNTVWNAEHGKGMRADTVELILGALGNSMNMVDREER